jgi:hypothetical protein
MGVSENERSACFFASLSASLPGVESDMFKLCHYTFPLRFVANR